MDEFFVYLSEKCIYIVKLNDIRFMPLTLSLPDKIKEGMQQGKVSTFNTLENVQRYVYSQIGFNEIYKLGLNNGLGDWVNKPISRISGKK